MAIKYQHYYLLLLVLKRKQFLNRDYNNLKDPLGHCFPGSYGKASPTLI